MIGPVMEQPQYNMLARERVEKDYLSLYEHYGLGLTIFSPLKIGILTGKYNDGIPSDSRLATSDDNFVKSMNSKFGDEDWVKQLKVVKALKVSSKNCSFMKFLLTLLQAHRGQGWM